MKKVNNPEIQIIGPFATEYSLSKVNRELALHLLAGTDDYNINLWADTNVADRLPNTSDYKKYPYLRELFIEQKHHSKVAIINTFPKTFPHSFGLDKISADIKIAYLAWEESAFPAKIVEEFNTELHGIMVTSEHVLNILRNAGVKIPIVNVGEGVNQNLLTSQKFDLKTRRNFRFLHISSGLPRKGVDILFKGFLQEFSKDDDVVLVIKTHRNEANVIPDLISKLVHPNSPEIEVIYDDTLGEGQIAYLYEQADTVVIPSRAEGFGLPIAEAMLKKVPVITTGYSGQMDFVSKDTSWLLDYDIVKANSQLGLVNSYWAEPSIVQLQEYMRFLFESTKTPGVKEKIERAYEIARGLTWEKTTQKVLEFIKFVESTAELKKQKLAVVTTYNTRCGIAEYSKDLYSLIESSFQEVRYYANTDAEVIFRDSENIKRTWEYSEGNFASTIEAIKTYNPDIVHIQYNSSFYSFGALNLLVKGLKQQEIKVFLTLHSIPDLDLGMFRDCLDIADRIFVHSKRDFEKLKRFGYKNTEEYMHGIREYSDEDREKLRQKLDIKQSPIIASHGMVHEKKGLLEIIKSLNLLVRDYPDILFLSINAVNNDNMTSAGVFRQMKNLVEKYNLQKNVLFIPEFIEKQEIIKLLHLADILLLPYDDLGEGASGAVRYSLSARRPVITTNSDIFNDLGGVVYRIDDNTPETIAVAVKTLLDDESLYQYQVALATDFVKRNSWEKQSREYLSTLGTVLDT